MCLKCTEKVVNILDQMESDGEFDGLGDEEKDISRMMLGRRIRANLDCPERGKPNSLAEAEAKAREIAAYLKEQAPKGWGFICILAETNGGQGLTYISDCQRQDIIKMLRSTAEVLEARKDSPAEEPHE